MLGADFAGGDDVCLILGDNIFYMGFQMKHYREVVQQNSGTRATIFAYHVSDPGRFGVVEFNEKHEAVSIEEKPAHHKSNYACTGLYFYPGDVCARAVTLKPSARGELEIADLNNLYLKDGLVSVEPMECGVAWLDAGTPDSLLNAGQYMQIMEKRQGLKISCVEEIAYHKGFIDDRGIRAYCQKVFEECHELY